MSATILDGKAVLATIKDELRTRLAQQRIGMEQYLALAKQTPEELATELREPASRRVKTDAVMEAPADDLEPMGNPLSPLKAGDMPGFPGNASLNPTATWNLGASGGSGGLSSGVDIRRGAERDSGTGVRSARSRRP